MAAWAMHVAVLASQGALRVRQRDFVAREEAGGVRESNKGQAGLTGSSEPAGRGEDT